MNRFNITVIIVATVVLICTFLFFLIRYSKRDKTFSPVVTDCPDYWTVNQDGTCNIPTDGKNTGSLQARTIYSYQIDDRTAYSLLPEFYSIPYDQVLVGTPYTNSNNNIKGYYKTEIPNGYDENNPQINRVDFNDPLWSKNGVAECEIMRWSKIHNIAWDGMNTINTC